MSKLKWSMRAFGVFLLCATAALAVPALNYTVLLSFSNGFGGSVPFATLVQGANGDLYGTTQGGGGHSSGTVFKVTPSGTWTLLYGFCSVTNCDDGTTPYGSVVQASNGTLYGTTYGGGANDDGTVFKLTGNGTLTTLHSFDITDGRAITAGLVQATNGKFYGITASGGANNEGTVFQITSGGAFTTIYNFCSQGGANCTDGAEPYGALIQATDGNLYGTTVHGGTVVTQNNGTVFKITTTGTLTTLYDFCSPGGGNCTDGANPYGPLIQATDGNLYGTTYAGGTGTLGTVFQITTGGALTTLHSFDLTDGADILSGLVQGNDMNLYGTAGRGGANDNAGTMFKITTGGAFTPLYNFCAQTNCVDGNIPEAGLVQDTNGKFYGTTAEGGTLNFGVAFDLSVNLTRFVTPRPTSGAVGAAVEILGTNLAGATSVTFNGTPQPAYTVHPTYITTTVPAGATTGTIKVATPGGMLFSNVAFQVP